MPTSPKLRIENDEAVRLAEEIAELTGEPLEAIIVAALKERLVRERRRSTKGQGEKRIVPRHAAIADRLAAYPVIDDRSPAEPAWYDTFPAE